MATIQIFGVEGLPEIEPGADLAAMIHAGAITQGEPLADGDVVIVTSQIVSKAEGRGVALIDVEASPFATAWAERGDKDPRLVEVVLRESKRVIRQIGPVLITETHHGFCCANSGVDQSSSGAEGRVLVLPEDPDATCRAHRARFAELGVEIAAILSHMFGFTWRDGRTDIAFGFAHKHPLYSYFW